MLQLQENLGDARQSKGEALMHGLGEPVTVIRKQAIRLTSPILGLITIFQIGPVLADMIRETLSLPISIPKG